MAILRLKTETKQQMVEVLCKAGLSLNEDGELITAAHGYFVSMCGTLCKETGVMLTDSDGNEYAEKVAIDGYHANLATTDGKIIKRVKSVTIKPSSKLTKIAGEK